MLLFENVEKVHESYITGTAQTIGHLNFACAVDVPAFLRRMIDLTMGLQKPHHKKSHTLDVRVDLKPWFVFIDTFNDICMVLTDRWDSWAALDLYIDASNIGFGGYFNDRYFAGVWPVNSVWHTLHIPVKELFPLVVALGVLGCPAE
ncbi:hypothetical protein MAR_007069 [Mya arenaria]|uniref:Uncharacterized protein n=1 Tax=Mya arenaria TaxID=6604 RepID=A0ABY7DCG4_MYAAR|nr:hypothetical protein MAR_007069 [Mya arenaria]